MVTPQSNKEPLLHSLIVVKSHLQESHIHVQERQFLVRTSILWSRRFTNQWMRMRFKVTAIWEGRSCEDAPLSPSSTMTFLFFWHPTKAKPLAELFVTVKIDGKGAHTLASKTTTGA